MRFSIKTMLLATALIAAIICGLLCANVVWAACFFTAAFMMPLLGLVGAIVQRGRFQASWIGFAIFAGGYFWIAMIAEGGLKLAPNQNIWHEPKLITTYLLIWAGENTRDWRRDPGDMRVLYEQMKSTGVGPRLIRYHDSGEYFIQVGHSVFTLVFALAGGWFGSWLYRRDISRQPREPLARG